MNRSTAATILGSLALLCQTSVGASESKPGRYDPKAAAAATAALTAETLSTPAPTPAAPSKAPAAKTNAKPEPKAARQANARRTPNAAAASVAAAAPAAAALSPSQTEAARTAVMEQVQTGRMVCELGNVVQVSADSQNPGAFLVQIKQQAYHMTPVLTSTGVIRLEDARQGAMWMQLPHKSMLMNQKLWQRVADECQSPEQRSVAQAMKNAPPPSLLDEPGVARK